MLFAETLDLLRELRELLFPEEAEDGGVDWRRAGFQVGSVTACHVAATTTSSCCFSFPPLGLVLELN